MQTDAVNLQIATKYLATLDSRAIPHKRVFLIFSGVPGCGKTTLARRLASDLHAQYIRHDDIRAIVRRHGYDVKEFTISRISRLVVDMLLEKGDANQFIIFDASLDRTWKAYFDYAEKHDAKRVILRLNVPRQIVEERIKKRSRDDFGKMGIDDLDLFYEQFENSKRHVKATIELEYNYDYTKVLRLVRELIS